MSRSEPGEERFFLPGTAKAVGFWNEGTKTYRTERTFPIHFSHRQNGYGISARVINALVERGCEWVVVDETRESGSRWRTRQPFERWRGAKNKATLRASDGEQVFVSRTALGRGERLVGPLPQAERYRMDKGTP